MRISGIENYIGGTQNVKALSITQGEQRIVGGQVLNPDNTPMDITNFEITAKVDFYLAEMVVSSRSLAITSLAETNATKFHTFVGVKTDAENGLFKITIPEEFYVTPENEHIEIYPNLSTNVPLAIMYIDYNLDASSPDSAKRSSSLVFVVRRGSPSIGL